MPEPSGDDHMTPGGGLTVVARCRWAGKQSWLSAMRKVPGPTGGRWNASHCPRLTDDVLNKHCSRSFENTTNMPGEAKKHSKGAKNIPLAAFLKKKGYVSSHKASVKN